MSSSFYNLEIWKKATEEHCGRISQILKEDKELKEMFVEHLRKFFNGFEMVEFSKDFRIVTMIWAWDDDVTINKDSIGDFEMEWIITKGASSDGGTGINVIVFPFGRGD